MNENTGRSSKTIEADNISVKFGDKVVLDNASLSVQFADLVVIGGPSGGGKTTLLRVLNRLQEPDSGAVYFDGEPIASYDVTKLRQRVCYLQQTPIMVGGTVKDNLLVPFRFKATAGRTLPDDKSFKGYLERFQMDDVSLSDDAQNLSVGQKQRLSFIRIILLNPEVLLLDEPTSALDAESREIVEEHIESLVRDRRATIIMVTHTGVTFKNVKMRKFNLSNGQLTEFAQ
jgi:putative ABC transport system ATP-binding protein